MGTKKWTGAGSGALQGAGTGFAVGGPLGAIAGGLYGGILGGVAGNEEDELTEYERAQLEEEKRKREMESGFSHLMALRGAKQGDRSQVMNTLQFLASQRATAAQNSKRRLLRDTILS
jgi:hypothetical protein